MSIKSLLHAQITRWVDDDPQPGVVECRIVDRFGREWLFIEKSAVVTAADLSSASVYPQPGVIGCTIVSRGHDESNRAIAEIDTEEPWGIESTEGVTRFHVFADQLAT